MNNINTLNDSKNLSRNHQSFSGNPDKFTAVIRKMNEGELAETNCVWMNAKDVQRYFPEQSGGNAAFARIANRVYCIVAKSWIKPGEIGLNPVQFEEVSTVINKDDTVLITPYRQVPSCQRDLTKAKFIISPQSQDDTVSISKNILDVSEIKNYFHQRYEGHFLKEGQVLHCNFNNREFYATFHSGESHQTPEKKSYFSSITPTTELFFESVETAPYILSERINTTKQPTFKFDVSITGLENYPDTMRPLIYNVEKFEEEVRLALRDKWLVPGMFVEYSITPGVDIKVTLKETLLPKKPTVLSKKEAVYTKAYRLTPDAKLSFISDNADVCGVRGEPLKPTRVTFRICMIDALPGFDSMQENIHNWIDVSEVGEKIRERIDLFSANTKFFLEYKGYLLNLEVFAIDHVNLVDRDAVNMKHWELSKDTRIFINLKSGIDLNLIPDMKTHSLKKMSVYVSIKKTQKGIELTEVDMEDLKQAIRDFLPKERCLNQIFTVDLGNDLLIDVKVKDMAFKSSRYNGTIYPHLGKVTSDTELAIEYDNYQIWMNNKPKMIRFKNGDARQTLENAGLTGLPEKIVEAFELIAIPLGELREIAKKMGIKSPNGLLLYGAPGTGKTTFANALGELLDVPKTNIVKVKHANILSKWVGETEKNIKALFDNAHNHKDQRFIVIFDEIESLCEKRSKSTSSPRTSLVNTLLEEMSSAQDLDNLIVIGTTNQLDRIDEAFLRPGRFSEKVEFPLPDTTGRRKILEYYIKDLQEEDVIEDNIDLDRFAAITKDFSGDHLKGLVKKASKLRLRKLAKLKLTMEQVEKHPDRKITNDDFLEAYNSIKPNVDGDDPPPHMYT